MAQVQSATIYSRQNRLLKWRAALGDHLQGGPRPRFLAVGDSKMMGAGASVSSANNFTNGAYNKRRTMMLAKLMTAAGYNAIDAGFVGSNNAPVPASYDDRFTLGSGWSFSSGTVGFHFGNACLQNTGGGAGVASFSPVGTFDTIDIIYAQGPTIGTFTVSDGATLIDTIDGNNAQSRTVRRTITLASRGSGKTLNFSRTSGNIFIFAVSPYDTTVPSIELLNGAAFGSATTNWVATGTLNPGNTQCWLGYAPHLTLIALGANDKNTGVAAATYQTNIQTLITRAKVSGDVILLNESYGSGGYANNSADFRQALIDLAAANGCLFHDEAARVNITDNPSWFSDTIHEKAFAHADEAAALLPLVLPHLMAA